MLLGAPVVLQLDVPGGRPGGLGGAAVPMRGDTGKNEEGECEDASIHPPTSFSTSLRE